MQKTKALLTIGAVVVAAAIAYAFIVGDFFAEAEVMLPLPWFHLSMVDLYIGFFLFAGWILFREASTPRAIIWIVLLCLLGNVLSCIYALRAAVISQGDWRQFWMGARARNASA